MRAEISRFRKDVPGLLMDVSSFWMEVPAPKPLVCMWRGLETGPPRTRAARSLRHLHRQFYLHAKIVLTGELSAGKRPQCVLEHMHDFSGGIRTIPF